MRLGQLRHRLSILSRTSEQDGYGAPSKPGWAVENVVFGSIRPLGTVERVEAAKMTGSASHLATIRAQGVDVNPKKRVRFGTRIFEVVGQMNYDERNIKRQVLLKELI